MPYVQRTEGNITGVFKWAQPGFAEEFLPDDSPELLALAVDKKWWEVRVARNHLLQECDWSQLPDAPIDQITKNAWTQYRQKLRDIPQTHPAPNDVAWPTPPK